MKKLMSLVAAPAAVALLAGASVAQTQAPAAPATPAASTPAKAPAVKNITGEFVGMNKAAKTATVKYVMNQKPTEITFSVDEALLTSLTEFKAGDRVKVTYEEVDGKHIAKAITKG